MTEFAQSISTVLFMVCTLIFGALMPSQPSDEPSVAVAAEPFELIGEWEAFGLRYKFGERRVRIGSQDYAYRLIDGALELTYRGEVKSIPLEIESNDSILLGGVRLYRIK